MEYQSFGRCQKPKGSNIKQVLKLMLVLVFSGWLLYQIKQTETKNYGGQTKLVAGCGGVKLLGRKGMSTRLDERSLPESRKVDSVGEARGMDHVSDGAVDAGVIMEEIDEVQSYRDENGVPPDSNEDTEIKEVKNEMHENVAVTAANAGVIMEEIDVVQSYHDENGVPPDSNEGTEIKEDENEMYENVVASTANVGVIMEEIDEAQSFHDENGVPPESNEENISTFSEVNWLKKINIRDVTNGEDNDVEMKLEGSMNATQDSEEINMGTTTYVDTSGSQSRNIWR
ncbi:uncharacterized protein LOC131603836 [Vicia villosa]|uniref:uncharacterized protein LOC131603836 n=1 Tax=Vicia villosa TaxID=3911 RepID=UPI00273BB3D1|nr:uncharacterized protein LOC131603836 [Vicia villosa]